MRFATAAAVLAWVGAAPACLAANASNPYGNIDPRNDAGNDTGDSQVERLNQAQLNASTGGGYAGGYQAPGYGWAPRPNYVQAPPYYQQPGYAWPGYPSAPYAPPAYAPPAYAPPGYAYQGYAYPGYAPSGYAP